MALDRQSIERRDFPVSGRGYDPEAVDAHLAALADEIADYQRSAGRRSETLASAASEQVRAIVEAAEAGAANIQREAETEAREIRVQADREAQSTRARAAASAREHVDKVAQATSGLLTRLDTMQSELGPLVESLRTGSEQLTTDLQSLEGEASTDANGRAAAPHRDVAAARRGDVAAALRGDVAAAPRGDVTDAPRGDVAAPDDAEGARLIALNMALDGTPREAASRYLAENFSLSDRDDLLNEVYASVEG